MGKRVLGGWALLVFVFLYAPIAVVVVYAFNGGRQVLNWEGFSTKWFGEALADPTITEPFRNSLVIAVGQRDRRLRARDDARARAAAACGARCGSRSTRSST